MNEYDDDITYGMEEEENKEEQLRTDERIFFGKQEETKMRMTTTMSLMMPLYLHSIMD